MEETAVKATKSARKSKVAPAAGKETFQLAAPDAGTVMLAGSFTQWETSPIPMKHSKDGTWKATVSLPSGTHEYRFLVDGMWVDDPNCPHRKPNGLGGENCVRIV